MWTSYKDTITDHEMSLVCLHLFLGNTGAQEKAFDQVYPSSHHLDSPAYLQ
jgi:hypothetical protein